MQIPSSTMRSHAPVRRIGGSFSQQWACRLTWPCGHVGGKGPNILLTFFASEILLAYILNILLMILMKSLLKLCQVFAEPFFKHRIRTDWLHTIAVLLAVGILVFAV